MHIAWLEEASRHKRHILNFRYLPIQLLVAQELHISTPPIDSKSIQLPNNKIFQNIHESGNSELDITIAAFQLRPWPASVE